VLSHQAPACSNFMSTRGSMTIHLTKRPPFPGLSWRCRPLDWRMI
jgi:hypothetical protein